MNIYTYVHQWYMYCNLLFYIKHMIKVFYCFRYSLFSLATIACLWMKCVCVCVIFKLYLYHQINNFDGMNNDLIRVFLHIYLKSVANGRVWILQHCHIFVHNAFLSRNDEPFASFGFLLVWLERKVLKSCNFISFLYLFY